MGRTPVLWGAVASSALAAAIVVVALRVGESEPEAAPPPAAPAAPARDEGSRGSPKGAAETCGTRSEADFGDPFTNPRNLVVGPLVLVGGAAFTPPSVVRGVGGQKYPVLVRAAHTVRLYVPEEARAFAGLGYGPLPQGEITLREAHKAVTFTACPAEEPSYSDMSETVGATTFWSGFVVTDAPHCVPLDVYVDEDPAPRRIVLELGVRPCAGAGSAGASV